MFNDRKFRSAVILSGKTIPEVASAMGMNTVTLYRKMNGTSDFYSLEIQKFCDFVGVDNPCEIFFAKEVS